MKKILCILLCLVAGLEAGKLDLAGSVISDNQKMITSRYMGFVKDVHVSEGDIVKKGAPLYSIDSKEIDSAKTQAQLAISQAKLSYQMNDNQYQNIKLNLSRHKRLLKQDMVSKYDVENLELAASNLKAMMRISKTQIAQAKAKLKEVENSYKYLKLQAPNDGVILSVNIKVGEMAMPGTPAVIISDLSDLKITAEVSESNLKNVQIGTKVEVSIPSSNLKTSGKISAIIPSSNPTAHTFKVKIDFDTKKKIIYPGMYALITIN